VVTEEMLTDLPEPVRRYLRYTGRSAGRSPARCGTGPRHVRRGHGRMLVKVASLGPVVDASSAQTDQAAMMRY
jgi:hypothetical protein